MAQSQYATIADLQALGITRAAADRFGVTAMNAQLQAASSDADDHLSSQFTLPLLTWDMGLTMRVCNIAAYRLYKSFGFSPQAPGDDLVTEAYKKAFEWLIDIREKRIFPQYTDSSGTTPELEAGADVISDQPVGFTNRGLTNGVNCTNGWPWGW